VKWAEVALGIIKRSGVSRIPFSAMRSLEHQMTLDVDRRDLESEHVERWLAEHFICRIPGSGGERK